MPKSPKMPPPAPPSFALRPPKMASTLRFLRHFSASADKISISKPKSIPRCEFDHDKPLPTSSSAAPTEDNSPISSRRAQDLTVRRLARSRRFSDIVSFLESLKSDSKIKREDFISSLIRSYGNACMFDRALETYHQMDQFGTPRSVISFNALLSACVESKLYDKVPVLFNEIRERYKVLPNEISYGILVKSYCKNDEPEKVMELLEEMETKGVEVTVCSSVLNYLYSKGKIAEAELLWDRTEKRGCKLDVDAYNAKICNAVHQGPERVKGLIEEMENSGLKPDIVSYNHLITCYCMSGMMEDAVKVYEGLNGYGSKPNAATFRTLISHLCNSREYEKGYKIFRDSVRVHRIPHFHTLRYLAEGLLEKKKMKEAAGLIRTMRKRCPPDLVNAWMKDMENLRSHPNEEQKEDKRPKVED